MVKKYLFIFLIINTFSAASLYAEDMQTGWISGQMMIKDGGPMAGGIVNFFNDKSGPPPATDKYWRVPDEMAEIDEDGLFSVELPEGKYYIGAIKRVSGSKVGPPGEGDYFFVSQDKQGKQKAHVLKTGESIDLGVISEAVPYKPVVAEEMTGIEGTILNVNGSPVAGAIVSAHRTPLIRGLPLFVSGKTGNDGKYLIGVHEGGKYYLRVRDVYGGGPPTGRALMSGPGATAVTVETGEILKGIDIKIMRHPGN